MKNVYVVVFDGTCHFIEDSNFVPNKDDGEEIVYRGNLEDCGKKVDELNELMY